jgi:hypothetical protein
MLPKDGSKGSEDATPYTGRDGSIFSSNEPPLHDST